MVNYKKLGKLLIWRCKQKKVGSQLPTATMAEIEETETVPSILLPCTSCNRTFRPEALAKHSKVCEKTLMKKRKQFDSSKQRLQGTEIESFVIQTVPKTNRKKEAHLNLSKSKWKEKVEQVRAIQAVKKQAETPLSSQVVKPSDHEECPYCGRSFGPKAYERHTEFCKEQLHKLKVSNNNNSEARERLKVRTTYRGPLTNKVLNRDRYQPNRNRDPSPVGLSSSDIYDDTPKSRGLSRNSSLRSSLRCKPETTPPPPLRRTMTQINSPSRGPRSSPKDLNETDLLQKSQSFSNKPRMISKEPIEKRMKPTNSKSIAQPSSKTSSSNPKSPPKLNNIDVNTFKELNVISCFTFGLSKPVNDLKLVNSHNSPLQVNSLGIRTVNSKSSLSGVPKSANATSNPLKAGDGIKQINDRQSSDVQETINSETPLNAAPLSEIVSPDLPKDANHLKLINDHHQDEIVNADLLKAADHLKLVVDHHSSCVNQERIFFETPLNVVPQREISSHDLPKADHCLKSINDNNSSVLVQKTMKPETSTNVVPKSEIMEVLSSNNCSEQPINDRGIDLTPRNSNFLTEEINKPTGHSKTCNQNLAYTIEFEHDNRFLVYEHHKVGPDKSPLISKKRVSKSYESIKSFSNKEYNFEDIEIQSNVPSEPVEPLKNKNLLVINKVKSSAPNLTQNCEVSTTQTDDLMILNPSNKAALTWKERVLEFMEVSGNSSNKNLSTLSNNNSDQIDLDPISESKSVVSHSEAVKNINNSDSNDKYTDIDKSLLIDQTLIDILSPNKKSIENITDTLLCNSDLPPERNLQKSLQLDSEGIVIIDQENIQNVEICDEIVTSQNNFLDADLYFDEESNYEIGKMQNDDSLDVDMYFVEENNVANEVLREERSNLKKIVKDEQSAEEAIFSTDLDSKNVSNVLDSDDFVDPIHIHSQGIQDNSSHLSGYETYEISEELNINTVNADNLGNTEVALDDSFVNEYEFNDLVYLDDDINLNQIETFIEDNDILKNVSSGSPKIEKKIEFQSLSDSELQKKQVNENEVSILTERDLDTPFQNEDVLNFGQIEVRNSPTLVKDKILRLAGQEFVLMANKNKQCDTFERFEMDHNCDTDSEIKNMQSPISQDYNGFYKPNTYCRNTHMNNCIDNIDIYSDIFSHLKRSNEEGLKMTWQTVPRESECCTDFESISEKDSIDTNFAEDSSDESYIFQPNSSYENIIPFETESFNHPVKKMSVEEARYSFSSSSSSYNNEEDQHSMNKNSIISQESLSDDSPLPFISSKEQSNDGCKSSRIPLLKSRTNKIYKSNTLPPLFAESKTSAKCDNQNNRKKTDFSKCSKNLKNDYYTHFSNIKNSSEESDSDWDLSDYDTYQRKKTVFTRSSKTVYNKYYEQVEYSKESNEFQTIKTSVSNLPLPHADFFKENRLKLPKIQSKHVPIDHRVHRKKTMDFEKLPLLRNFEDCKCSSRKEKETDEDVENRNHKFLNNSIDSAYSRSSGAEGDTGKVEMSKFCHECGAKYPIAGAKFCCNCGMRRITL